MVVRTASTNDLEGILSLNKSLFDYETKFSSEYNLDWTYSDVGRRYFKSRLEGASSIVAVAVIDKKIVGYVLSFIATYPFRAENPIAEIENMFISPEYRGKGIGEKLIGEIKRQAKEKGVKRIKVAALANNDLAIRFYKKCGFKDFEAVLETEVV